MAVITLIEGWYNRRLGYNLCPQKFERSEQTRFNHRYHDPRHADGPPDGLKIKLQTVRGTRSTSTPLGQLQVLP